ncbi:MAG: SPOR domain-containing protein [Chitinophagales bacterium]
MKPINYILLYALLATTTAWSQEGVIQSPEISNMVESYRNYQKIMEFEDGFRIQISYTNNRDEAYKAKAQLYKEFETIPSYVEYEQPNYKLRIGDFKTKLQATALLQDVIKIYPGAFIVKDRIKKR